MTIDEITFEAMRNIYVKINDDYLPLEESKDILFLHFVTKKEENA